MSCSWGETDRRACHVGPAVTVWMELQPADTQRASHCGWRKAPSLVVGALGFWGQLSLAREATPRSRDERGRGTKEAPRHPLRSVVANLKKLAQK